MYAQWNYFGFKEERSYVLYGEMDLLEDNCIKQIKSKSERQISYVLSKL